MPIFTASYEGRSLDEFLADLRANGVRLVADVRETPKIVLGGGTGARGHCLLPQAPGLAHGLYIAPDSSVNQEA